MNRKTNIIIFILTIVAISFMTIGFASYDSIIELGGQVTIEPDGIIEVTRISTISSNNVSQSSTPIVNGSIVDFNIVFNGVTGDHYITYELEISNHSSYPYIYDEFAFLQQVTSSNDGIGELELIVTGINNGDTIKSKETKTIQMKFSLKTTDYTQTYTCSASTDLDGVQHQKGSLLTSLILNNNDLTYGKTGNFTLNVLNSYSTNVNFSLGSANNNFVLVDNNGNNLTQLTANANSDNNYTIYIKERTPHEYESSPQSTTILLQTVSLGNYIIQAIDLNVNIIGDSLDTTPPQITNIQMKKTNKNYGAKITWTATDDSEILNYVILLYDSNNNLIKQETVNGTTSSITVNFNTAGRYYAVIYGIDSLGNSGESELQNNNTNNTTCRRSQTANINK